jgi:hypothetical protein
MFQTPFNRMMTLPLPNCTCPSPFAHRLIRLLSDVRRHGFNGGFEPEDGYTVTFY